MNTTLAKTLQLEKKSDYLDFGINDMVKIGQQSYSTTWAY